MFIVPPFWLPTSPPANMNFWVEPASVEITPVVQTPSIVVTLLTGVPAPPTLPAMPPMRYSDDVLLESVVMFSSVTPMWRMEAPSSSANRPRFPPVLVSMVSPLIWCPRPSNLPSNVLV